MFPIARNTKLSALILMIGVNLSSLKYDAQYGAAKNTQIYINMCTDRLK